MASIFISYRREPSAMLANLIAEKLRKYGIDAYVDVLRLDSASITFPERLLSEIQNRDVFVCLLGDNTLESEWVQREIQHAFNLNKPRIPVFQEKYKPPSFPSPESIEKLLQHDGIHVLDSRNLYIEEAIDKLARLILTTVIIQKGKNPETRDQHDIATARKIPLFQTENPQVPLNPQQRPAPAPVRSPSANIKTVRTPNVTSKPSKQQLPKVKMKLLLGGSLIAAIGIFLISLMLVLSNLSASNDQATQVAQLTSVSAQETNAIIQNPLITETSIGITETSITDDISITQTHQSVQATLVLTSKHATQQATNFVAVASAETATTQPSNTIVNTLTSLATLTAQPSLTFTPTPLLPSATPESSPSVVMLSPTPSLPICPYIDLNQNGKIDNDELTHLGQHNGQIGEPEYATGWYYDINEDGIINSQDYFGATERLSQACVYLPAPTECDWADLDGNGKVEVGDFEQIPQAARNSEYSATGSSHYQLRYDLNFDGKINSLDLVKIDNLSKICAEN